MSELKSILLRQSLALADPPFTPMMVPPLSEGRVGSWKVAYDDTPRMIRGYFGGYRAMRENWVLLKSDSVVNPKKMTVWMSITPMELESAAHHVASAHGNVYIGGGGMGIVAWNCAMKKNVKRVVIVERDPEIVELLNRLAGDNEWPNWFDKVLVIQGDVLELSPREQFDVALIDIWDGIGAMEIRPDMQKIVKIVKAKEYAAWGGELDFITWCMENDIDSGSIESKHWNAYSKSIGVPLIQSKNPRMAEYALQAALQSCAAVM